MSTTTAHPCAQDAPPTSEARSPSAASRLIQAMCANVLDRQQGGLNSKQPCRRYDGSSRLIRMVLRQGQVSHDDGAGPR